MCQSRNSKKIYISGVGIRRVDSCMVHLITFINKHTSYKTRGSCCGHDRYNMSLVVRTPQGRIMDLMSGKFIERKRWFYVADFDGYYYIPETLEDR